MREMGDVSVMMGMRENSVTHVKLASGKSPKIKHIHIVKVSNTSKNHNEQSCASDCQSLTVLLGIS